MTTLSERFWGSVHTMTTIQRVIGEYDSRWAWDRAALRQRTAEALWEALNRHLHETIKVEVTSRLEAHAPVNAAQYELEYAAGYRQGRQAALIEAATKLKRHGHRSAVTRLLELADADVKTPARPQPAQSPADGPGHPQAAPDTQEGATGREKGPTEPQEGTYALTYTDSPPITDATLTALRRQQARRG